MSEEYGVIKSKSIPLSSDDFANTMFRSLGKYANETALVEVWSSKEITFASLKRTSESVGRHLLNIGVRKGDVVGIFAPNSIDWVVAFLGIIRIGAVAAAINCQLKQDELKHQLLTSGAKTLFTSSTLAPVALELSKEFSVDQKIIVSGIYDGCLSFDTMTNDSGDLPDLPSFEALQLSHDDPILIVFSSGTTGIQKAVVLSHRNLEAQRLIACVDLSTKLTAPKQIVFTPLSHVLGLLCTIDGLTDGSVTHFLQKFVLNEYLKLLHDLQIDHIGVVPPIAVLLAKSPEVDKFRLSLKLITCGAAPLSEEVEILLKSRFPGVVISQVYGMTESSGLSSIYPVTEETSSAANSTKPQSVGPPCANVLMKIVDENGKALGPRAKGEICIKGPGVMLGYLGNPEATATAIDTQGWLHTGDLGYYDEDGYFYVVDRLKELIKYKAFQIVSLPSRDFAVESVSSIPFRSLHLERFYDPS